VSFYTRGTPYEDEARGLIESCERLGLEHRIEGVPDRGSWEANCAMKASFVRDAWRGSPKGVAWVDADARLHRAPRLFAASGIDFAVHRCGGWQFASGTLVFARTPGAGALLDAWAELCETDPRRWDQESLDLAWERTVRATELTTLWLPQAYTKIFDRGDEDGTAGDPVVMHHQASRRLRDAVARDGAVQTRFRAPGAALERARRAARPRTAREMSEGGEA
jgi:hypothetical protein